MRRMGGVAALCAAAGSLAVLQACSGGGQDADSAAASLFFLDGSSVGDGQVWQINRPIAFRFSMPVDFSTVNPNTIQISQPNGVAAVGEFQSDPADSSVVNFLPRCPTMLDLSDAGLLPNGTTYRIRISDASTGAGSVQSTSGAGIEVAQTVTFTTPPSMNPLDLFIDPVPGPPTPLAGSFDENDEAQGTRLVFLDGSPAIPFELNETGQGVLEGFEVPLNLYSQLSSRTAVLVELNQPVNPTAENINPTRIQLQALLNGAWVAISTDVELVANCTESGSSVLLSPVGLLPQNRDLRVWIGPEFEDLVADRNILPLTEFAQMHTEAFRDEAGAPVDFADELLEEFVLGGPDSLEDTDAVFSTPSADWGQDSLSAAFAFTGTGGPGGDFDWHVQANTDFVLNTNSSTILGGPGGFPEQSQLVVNGVVNVRNFLVPLGSTLRIEGDQPATFLISGTMTVNGLIQLNGNSAPPIFNPNQPNIPAPGGAGVAGGGAGGIGSFLTNQVTPRGGSGLGAFSVAGLGGQGGESGWNPSTSSNGALRRAAGGGGGVLGPNSLIFSAGMNDFCLDQNLIGLDAESGFPGALTAAAAERPGEVMPWGGFEGPGPFSGTEDDDFWGTLVVGFAGVSPSILQGELPTPWAGAGGGAGGDATRASAYPPPQLIFGDNNKGAGGGGGAGSLTVLCLGDVKFGPSGRIEANGGHGTGGENTAALNRIGGGSGGGSGGHIVIQTGSQIDLSSVLAGQVAVIARGGQGGAGDSNLGGADINETVAALDATHVGVTDPTDTSDNPWIPVGPPNCGGGAAVVRGSGGDGGPGIIQFHVGVLPSDILPPGGSQSEILTAVQPIPVGYDRQLMTWVDQLVPLFGRFSQAQSKWVPLGGVAVDPDSDALQPIAFLLEGTDPADGTVLTTAGTVDELAPVLTPPDPIEADGLPSISEDDPRQLLVDATALTGDDAVYARNPALLRNFLLRVGGDDFDVESASADEDLTVLTLTVSSTGPELPASGQVSLIPRYFRVLTGATADALPDSASVQISFQATTADEAGLPDPDNVVPSLTTWATDIAELNEAASNPMLRFYRFRVEFEVGIGDADLSASTPRPTVQFLRTPFRF